MKLMLTIDMKIIKKKKITRKKLWARNTMRHDGGTYLYTILPCIINQCSEVHHLNILYIPIL